MLKGTAAFCFGYLRVEDLGDNVVTGVVLATGGHRGHRGRWRSLGSGCGSGRSAERRQRTRICSQSFQVLVAQMKAMGETILSVRNVFAHEIFRET